MKTAKAKKKLTKAEMRVAIAEDVLKQLRAGKITLAHVYLRNKQDYRPLTPLLRNAHDLQEVVDKITKTCKVCQLGACLLSKARLFNKVPIDKLTSYNRESVFGTEVYEALSDVFSDSQLNKIENAFEDQREYSQESDKTAVEATMENIVRNRGTFKP